MAEQAPNTLSPGPPLTPNTNNQLKKLLKIAAILLALIIVVVAVFNLFVQSGPKKRDAQRKNDLKALKAALEKSRAASKDSLYYPSALTATTLEKPGFIGKIPTDPKNESPYVYRGAPSPCTSTCTAFTLTACLENANDPEGTDPTSSCTTKSYQVTGP